MRDVKDLFFKLMTYLRTGDISDLDEKILAIVNSEKQIAERHFTKVVDLPAYRGYDYESVREFLINWYASIRTIAAIHRNISDAYSLDYESLSEYCRSLGFLFPDYIPKRNRATFLLELVNLYKIKGSPQGLLKLVQFLDYLDFKVLEYWLVADQQDYDLFYDLDFFYDIEPPKHLLFIGKQVGRILEDVPLQISYSYDQFREKLADGHWYYTRAEIGELDKQLKLNLPSLTPYFGLFNDQYVTRRWLPTYAILSRLIKQQWNDWVNHGINERTILFEPYGHYISWIELVLGLWWTFYVYYGYIDINTNEPDPAKFATLVPDPLKRHICYCLNLAEELDKAQFRSDYERLFNSIPSTREELYNLLAERQDKFTAPNNWTLFPDPRDIRTNLVTLNNDFFEFLYREIVTGGDIRHLLNQMWEELDNILGALDLALSTFSNNFIFEGQIVYAVVNFFKPIHARLANLAFVMNLTDPIGDAVRIADTLPTSIQHMLVDGLYEDHCGYYDCPCQFYDEEKHFLLCDNLSYSITQLFNDLRFREEDRLLPVITLLSQNTLERLNDNQTISTSTILRSSTRSFAELYDTYGLYDLEMSLFYDLLQIDINTGDVSPGDDYDFGG